jgi:hypothetical protein
MKVNSSLDVLDGTYNPVLFPLEGWKVTCHQHGVICPRLPSKELPLTGGLTPKKGISHEWRPYLSNCSIVFVISKSLPEEGGE